MGWTCSTREMNVYMSFVGNAEMKGPLEKEAFVQLAK
jgi:hypothetical protein